MNYPALKMPCESCEEKEICLCCFEKLVNEYLTPNPPLKALKYKYKEKLLKELLYVRYDPWKTSTSWRLNIKAQSRCMGLRKALDKQNIKAQFTNGARTKYVKKRLSHTYSTVEGIKAAKMHIDWNNLPNDVFEELEPLTQTTKNESLAELKESIKQNPIQISPGQRHFKKKLPPKRGQKTGDIHTFPNGLTGVCIGWNLWEYTDGSRLILDKKTNTWKTTITPKNLN